jgi:hypothetical protein
MAMKTKLSIESQNGWRREIISTEQDTRSRSVVVGKSATEVNESKYKIWSKADFVNRNPIIVGSTQILTSSNQ